MKKILTAFLCLILILGLATTAFAAEGEVTYTFQGGTLTISGNGTVPGDRALTGEYGTKTRKVVIEEGITAIEDGAFRGFEYLTSVTIAGSVETIGSSAFYECGSLSEVIFSEGLKTIEASAFCYCRALKGVKLPNSVETLENSAFKYCSAMTELSLGNGLKVLGTDCFRDCTNLTSVTIPGSVQTMEGGVFYDCDNLETVVIKEGVPYIGTSAFGYSGVKSVTLPKSLRKINDSAFNNCDNLGDVVIPEGVTSIGASAFYGCESMKKVTLPSTLTEMKGYAFEDCEGLEEVTIPGGVSVISYGAFDGCSSIRKLTLNEGLIQIETSAFQDCSALKEINIPGTVAEIGMLAFSGCSSAEKLTVNDGVIKIGGSAFSSCDALKSVYLSDTLITLSDDAFRSCKNLKSLTIPGSVSSIGYYPFWGSGLLTVTLEDGITAIPGQMFNGCTNLIYVTIPDTVTSVGSSAFYNCGRLNHILVTGADKGITVSDDVAKKATWHFHATGKEISVEDTCTETYAYCSICQKSIFSEQKNKAQHTFGEWAAVSGTNQEKRTCSVCGHAETRKNQDATQKENPFSDVQEGKFYYEPVLWAVDEGITTGYKDGTFKPSKTCTRAEVVTFIWRAAGRPQPASKNNPFTDVSESAYYYDAVLWAVEKGITLGKTATTFAPSDTCTRGQIVTFLWRYSGEPGSSMGNPFGDVANGKFYYTAVLWAVEEGITTGYKDGTFKPGNFCTRDQIVTFLYRYLVK